MKENVEKNNNEKARRYSKDKLFFTILDDCDSCRKYFETLYQDEDMHRLYISYWEDHVEGEFYAFRNLYPESSFIPLSFPQSVILIDQIRRNEKQENIYKLEGFAERIDMIKENGLIVIPKKSISFLAEEDRKIIGIGCNSWMEQEIVNHNINDCAMLGDYIYTYLSTEIE
jgi:hypothetical protein